MGFLQCLEEDTYDLSLVEPEGPVVGSADQVVGVDVLNDSQWTSHALDMQSRCQSALTPGMECVSHHGPASNALRSHSIHSSGLIGSGAGRSPRSSARASFAAML